VSAFSSAELTYLSERRLGRLATVDAAGLPHVVPVGWSYNSATDTIDVTGRDLARTAKFRNAIANPLVALVVDDVLPPWRPRALMVRGRAEALSDAVDEEDQATGPMLRIHPLQVLSWGLAATST
jgi:pyridoxamine 5'-phosphate oxidase family protein